MAKKKKKSWKKNLAKAAVGLGLGYAAFKGLGKGKGYKNVFDTGAITKTPGSKWGPWVGGKQHTPKPYLGPDTGPPSLSAKGGRIGKKGGGRTGKQFGGGLNRRVARPVGGVGAPVRPLAYKHGGKVKSMGVAKRGGGIAKK